MSKAIKIFKELPYELRLIISEKQKQNYECKHNNHLFSLDYEENANGFHDYNVKCRNCGYKLKLFKDGLMYHLNFGKRELIHADDIWVNGSNIRSYKITPHSFTLTNELMEAERTENYFNLDYDSAGLKNSQLVDEIFTFKQSLERTYSGGHIKILDEMHQNTHQVMNVYFNKKSFQKLMSFIFFLRSIGRRID